MWNMWWFAIFVVAILVVASWYWAHNSLRVRLWLLPEEEKSLLRIFAGRGVCLSCFNFFGQVRERQVKKILTLIGARVSKDPAQELCLKIKSVKDGPFGKEVLSIYIRNGQFIKCDRYASVNIDTFVFTYLLSAATVFREVIKKNISWV